MALVSGWFKRSGQVTDVDGRQLVAETGGIADTISAAASASAPTTAAAIVSLAGLISGAIYRIRATVILSGTAETALTNLRLRDNSIAIHTIPSNQGGVQIFDFPRLTKAAAGNLDVIVSVNATAGSVYTVTLVATRVE